MQLGLGNYKEALKYLPQALEIQRQLFGEQHSDTARSLNNIGGTYADLGNYTEALKYQEKALEIQRQLFGE
jgi:tetratricopeptide (TPR) repeat protein